MSMEAISWAWKWCGAEVLTNGQKLVLLALADAANPDTRRCDPRHEFLARKAGLSASGVRKAVDALEDLGLLDKLARHRRAGGRLGSWQYGLRLDVEPSPEPVYRPCGGAGGDVGERGGPTVDNPVEDHHRPHGASGPAGAVTTAPPGARGTQRDEPIPPPTPPEGGRSLRSRSSGRRRDRRPDPMPGTHSHPVTLWELNADGEATRRIVPTPSPTVTGGANYPEGARPSPEPPPTPEADAQAEGRASR